MLEYDRINISEGILMKLVTRVNVIYVITGTFLEWFFRFQKVCDVCHDMTQKPKSLNDVGIVTVRKKDYRIHF